MKNRKRNPVRHASREADEERCCFGLESLMKCLGDDEEFDVILYERVSDVSQSDSLEHRIDEDKKLIEKLSDGRINIAGVFRDTCNGRPSRLHRRDGLKAAKELADEDGLLIVSSSVDRFLRPENLVAQTGQFVPLLESDVQAFKKFLDGTIVATIIPPNTDLRKVRGLLSRMGQQATGNAGGRPRKAVPGEKKRLRENYAPVAYRLRCRKNPNGRKTPFRKIAKILMKRCGIAISFRTIYGWVQWQRKRLKSAKATQ